MGLKKIIEKGALVILAIATILWMIYGVEVLFKSIVVLFLWTMWIKIAEDK